MIYEVGDKVQVVKDVVKNGISICAYETGTVTNVYTAFTSITYTVKLNFFFDYYEFFGDELRYDTTEDI